MKKPTTELVSVGSLFKQGIQLKIPVYQRQFKWDKTEAERFFQDYLEFAENYDPEDMHNDENIHFLGAIYLAKDDSESTGTLTTWDIVDGQQRITTLQLLISGMKRAIYELLYLTENDFQSAQKLSLHQSLSTLDKLLFTEYACEDEETGWTSGAEDSFKLRVRDDQVKIFSESLNNINLSQKTRMAKVIKTFKDLMIEKFNTGFFSREGVVDVNSIKNPTIWYKKLIRPIVNKIFLLKVELASIEDAYSTFERLNDRGVKLTVFELLNIKLLNAIRQDGKNQEKYEKLRTEIEKLCTKVKIKPSKILWQHFSIKYNSISEKELANAYSKKLKVFSSIENELNEIINTLKNYLEMFGEKPSLNYGKSIEIYKSMNTPFFKYPLAFLKTKGTSATMMERFAKKAISISWNANINNTSLGAIMKTALTHAVKHANDETQELFKTITLDNQMNEQIIDKTISKLELIKLTLFYDDLVNGKINLDEYREIEIQYNDEASEKRISNISAMKVRGEWKMFDIEKYSNQISSLRINFDFK